MGESKGGVDDSGGVCGEFGEHNTVWRGGGAVGGSEEVVRDTPRVQNGWFKPGNTWVLSGPLGSGPGLSETRAERSSVLGPSRCAAAAGPGC